jgi:LuxR family transcriptional regulator/LuxR family quorum-sensing system transcriptional regulator CciR
MEIEKFETAVERVESPQALWEVFTTFFRGTVIVRVMYHHLPPLGAPDAGVVTVSAEGMPEEMLDRYVAGRMWRKNPNLLHSLKTTEPFYFDEVTDHHALDHLNTREQAFLAEVRKADFSHGLGVRVFGPNGRDGFCGLGFGAGVRRLDPQDVRNYQWACQLAHLRYCAMLLPTFGPEPQLSRRETQVLGWVARGKTNTAIGEILGISAHTVDAHLRRIYLKLGVFDRISAAVRGIGVGLIHSEV